MMRRSAIEGIQAGELPPAALQPAGASGGRHTCSPSTTAHVKSGGQGDAASHGRVQRGVAPPRRQIDEVQSAPSLQDSPKTPLRAAQMELLHVNDGGHASVGAHARVQYPDRA